MDLIHLGHGSGGSMMHQLIREYFVPAFNLTQLGDSAVLESLPEGRIALTTDSYVISPLFFPGGDIGHLSVCGTINDLAVCGARPLYLTAGFIIEEGFPLRDLERILASMKAAAAEAGVSIIAGDTKVVDKGKGDGMFINTAGIGVLHEGIALSPGRVRPGDAIILSGSVGNHGMSVMAQRNNISFDPPILTDARPLNSLVESLASLFPSLHMMRDPTRGGLATTLKEIANESGCCMSVDERAIMVRPGVRGACELLGLDPLYVANEGVLIAIVDASSADLVLQQMRRNKTGEDACVIGEVVETPPRMVLLKTEAGGQRIVEMLPGDQLPRIC